jgi:hypothetical protein
MTESQVDPRAVELLNRFLDALLLKDADESARALAPLVHVSLHAPGGTDLSRDLRQFGHKKAHANALHYARPVQVVRVRTTSLTGIGFGSDAAAGRVDDYFIAKQPGVNGMPAPVKVFFPAGGGAPTISYMGSL